MKKILFFIATALMCSCTLFENEKDQLDNIVGKYWEEWKAVNRDTTCCVLDFDSIMPFEWDTLVYFYCLYPYEDKEEVKEYMHIHNLEDQRKYGPERLHFLKDGKIIHSVCLFMASDWAKYNRENEMYNFPKRNVQFSRFFAPCKKDNLKGI